MLAQATPTQMFLTLMKTQAQYTVINKAVAAGSVTYILLLVWHCMLMTVPHVYMCI